MSKCCDCARTISVGKRTCPRCGSITFTDKQRANLIYVANSIKHTAANNAWRRIPGDVHWLLGLYLDMEKRYYRNRSRRSK